MSWRALRAAAVLAASASPTLAAGPAIWVNTSYSLQIPAEGEIDVRITDQEKNAETLNV